MVRGRARWGVDGEGAGRIEGGLHVAHERLGRERPAGTILSCFAHFYGRGEVCKWLFSPFYEPPDNDCRASKLGTVLVSLVFKTVIFLSSTPSPDRASRTLNGQRSAARFAADLLTVL